MVTMQQIADRCGVSRGTVDRALHHKEGVREEVAERIRATAREMGYISNRLVMQQTQQWKIGVVLHSDHSPFVQMLCELFESFSERELLPNITVIVRAMQDTDVQHQLTLIDELVTTEHIDGLALMPLANTLVRDRINTLSEQQGIPVVTLNTDITDANRIAYVGADNIASGRAAAALLGMVMQGHGSVLPILGQRSGHYADSQRFTGFSTEMAESFPDIRVLHPECSFLDESLSERIAMRAIQSDSELRGIYLTSAGREGVYRAVHAAHRSEKLHIVVNDDVQLFAAVCGVHGAVNALPSRGGQIDAAQLAVRLNGAHSDALGKAFVEERAFRVQNPDIRKTLRHFGAEAGKTLRVGIVTAALTQNRQHAAVPLHDHAEQCGGGAAGSRCCPRRHRRCGSRR